MFGARKTCPQAYKHEGPPLEQQLGQGKQAEHSIEL